MEIYIEFSPETFSNSTRLDYAAIWSNERQHQKDKELNISNRYSQLYVKSEWEECEPEFLTRSEHKWEWGANNLPYGITIKITC